MGNAAARLLRLTACASEGAGGRRAALFLFIFLNSMDYAVSFHLPAIVADPVGEVKGNLPQPEKIPGLRVRLEPQLSAGHGFTDRFFPKLALRSAASCRAKNASGILFFCWRL